MARTIPICDVCGSTNILFDSYARWEPESQSFEHNSEHGNPVCECCEGECGTTDALYPLQISKCESGFAVENEDGESSDVFRQPPKDGTWEGVAIKEVPPDADD